MNATWQADPFESVDTRGEGNAHKLNIYSQQNT